MSDIVERLRSDRGAGNDHWQDVWEAAAEIERLRAALAAVVHGATRYDEDPDSAVARAAFDEGLAAAIRALPSPTDGHSQWRPIETAPHETLVLLYSPPAWPSEAKCEVGFASTGRRTPAPDGGSFSNMSRHGYATHWMPLPFPPDSTEGGK